MFLAHLLTLKFKDIMLTSLICALLQTFCQSFVYLLVCDCFIIDFDCIFIYSCIFLSLSFLICQLLRYNGQFVLVLYRCYCKLFFIIFLFKSFISPQNLCYVSHMFYLLFCFLIKRAYIFIKTIQLLSLNFCSRLLGMLVE